MRLHRSFIIALLLTLSFFSRFAQASPEADFWKWFQKNESMLFDFERDQDRVFDKLAAELHKVHPSLVFEFGPKERNRREFVISADGNRAAFPKVESLFAAAPSLPKWQFIKFRPRRAPFDLQYEGISVKAGSVLALLQADGPKVGITLYVPGYKESAEKSYMGIGFLLLDQALGEFDVETRVGFIKVQGLPANTSSAIPLARLPAAFDAFVAK